MILSIQQFLCEPPAIRKSIFSAAASDLGTPISNVEKDFWVTTVLNALFSNRSHTEPRLLFKGGTSLSKAFNLTSRFSEDIDVTIFKEDLGFHENQLNLVSLSGKKQRAHLDRIKEACKKYVQGPLMTHLFDQLNDLFLSSNLHPPSLSMDDLDPDAQTILFHYPTLFSQNNYTLPYVKLECGAKSALDPHCSTTIEPYIARTVQGLDFKVHNITTINPVRTFWDKIVILHGTRRWSDLRGNLRQSGHRISRHYYDLHQLLNSSVGDEALRNPSLGIDCVEHAMMYFNNNSFDLPSAKNGSFSIIPSPSMMRPLEVDYEQMKMMIFGVAPEFSDVIDSITKLDDRLQSLSFFSNQHLTMGASRNRP